MSISSDRSEVFQCFPVLNVDEFYSLPILKSSYCYTHHKQEMNLLIKSLWDILVGVCFGKCLSQKSCTCYFVNTYMHLCSNLLSHTSTHSHSCGTISYIVGVLGTFHTASKNFNILQFISLTFYISFCSCLFDAKCKFVK